MRESRNEILNETRVGDQANCIWNGTGFGLEIKILSLEVKKKKEATAFLYSAI